MDLFERVIRWLKMSDIVIRIPSGDWKTLRKAHGLVMITFGIIFLIAGTRQPHIEWWIGLAIPVIISFGIFQYMTA